jgi:hypothetical protein
VFLKRHRGEPKMGRLAARMVLHTSTGKVDVYGSPSTFWGAAIFGGKRWTRGSRTALPSSLARRANPGSRHTTARWSGNVGGTVFVWGVCVCVKCAKFARARVCVTTTTIAALRAHVLRRAGNNKLCGLCSTPPGPHKYNYKQLYATRPRVFLGGGRWW